jgi:tetratricopeptide (TPR) repeat protein
VAFLLAGSVHARAAETDWLARARQFYNQRQYDQAIAAAERALTIPASAAGARLVIGRSHLERFRATATVADLVAGRAALAAVRPDGLAARDRLDLLVGLAEVLYLDNRFGAAAELFASALDSTLAAPEARDTILDWWASARDRLVRAGEANHETAYRQVVTRMDQELGQNPASTTAAYWLAAASRGAGDLDRAWNAAVAGWVRAVLSPTGAAALRADLDHLVLTAIIPERARELGGDREQVTAALKEEWEAVKRDWKEPRN